MKTESIAVARGSIVAEVYDVRQIENEAWSNLSKADRLQLLQAGLYKPVQTVATTNTTCIGLDEARALSLVPPGEVDPVATFDVGTDDTAPTYNDTELGNNVYSADLVSFSADGNDFNAVAFLDTTEANDNTLVEGGLVSEAGRLLNHSTFTSIDKTPNREVTIDITITFTAQ